LNTTRATAFEDPNRCGGSRQTNDPSKQRRFPLELRRAGAGAALLLFLALLPAAVSCQGAEPGAEEALSSKGQQENKPTPLVTLEFSVAGMTCKSCAQQASRVLLSQVPYIEDARVDFETKAARISVKAPVARDQVRQALASLGFEARFPDDPPTESVLLPEGERAQLDIQTVTHGDALRIENHLAQGKITIFDYYADWCGPCHLLTPKLERLLLKYKDLALRKVDIVDWESEAARQASRDFRLPGLPFTRIFDDRGNLLGEVQGNFLEKIEEVLQAHGRAPSERDG